MRGRSTFVTCRLRFPLASALGIVLLSVKLGGCAPRRAVSPPPPKPLSAQTYSHYLRAQVAHFEGDAALSIAELQKALQQSPQEAPIALALLRALRRAGQDKRELRVIRKAVKQWPDDPYVWLEVGTSHQQWRNFSSAGQAYKRALSLGEGSIDTYLALAQVLQAQGKHKEATRALHKAHKADLDSPRPLIALARHDYENNTQESVSRAISLLTQATQLAPHSTEAWALLAACHYRQGNTSQGDLAIVTPFDRGEGRLYIAQQLFDYFLDLESDLDHPLAKRLSRVFDRDDLNLDTRISIAHWQLRLGKYSEALAWSRSVPRHSDAQGAIAELQVRAYRGLRQDDRALGIIDALPNTSASYALMQSFKAEILIDKNNTELARKTILDALTLHPDNADLVLAQAHVEERAGASLHARDILKAAIEAHPQASRPRYALASLETNLGNFAAAIEAISPFLEHNSQDIGALNFIGYTLIRVPGAEHKAAKLLRRALALAPDQSFILDSYGWLQLRHAQLADAAVHLERAARLSPTEPEVLWHLAELRLAQGKRAAGIALLKRGERFAISPLLRHKIQTRRQFLTSKP